MDIYIFFWVVLITILLISGISSINANSKEFVINQYLKLKLEQGRTIIYVKNRLRIPLLHWMK